jgi:hypothetical protein
VPGKLDKEVGSQQKKKALGFLYMYLGQQNVNI